MDLLWFLLEAGVALALLLGIVWWTWPRGARKDEDASRGTNDESTSVRDVGARSDAPRPGINETPPP